MSDNPQSGFWFGIGAWAVVLALGTIASIGAVHLCARFIAALYGSN